MGCPVCDRCGRSISRGNMCPSCLQEVLKGGSRLDKGISKFASIKTKDSSGNIFDSKLEYRRWEYLKLLEKAHVIYYLARQVKFVLIEKSKYGREISYIADFVYEMDGIKVVEDTKSEATKTSTYRLKKRLLAEKYGIVIKEVTKNDF